MSLKQYLIFLAFGTSIAFTAWFIVLLSINPVTSGIFGFLAFYLTLFIMLIGLFSTVATIIRIFRKKHITVESMIGTSLRQGILFATLFEISLILLSHEYLSIPILLLLILLISIIEFLFISKNKEPHRTT